MARYRKVSSGFLGTIIKTAVVLIVVMLVGFVGLQILSGGSCAHKIDNTIPTVVEAPQEIGTVAGIYYSKGAIRNDNGDIYMPVWWERQNGEWVKHDVPETLRHALLGYMTIRDR